MQKLVCVTVLTMFALMLSASAAAQGENPGFEDVRKDLKAFGDVTVIVGSKSIVVSWQGIEIGKNVSAWLREKVDGLEDGEQDGNVSEGEKDAAQALLRAYVQSEFDQYAHDARFNDHLLIDTTNPKGAVVSALQASGIEGPVVSETGITLSFVATVGFPTQSADVHTVKLDIGRYYFHPVDPEAAEGIVGDFSLTIKGAEGWTIDPASVQPGCAAESLQEGAMIFLAEDVNCFTERTGVLLGFSITGHDSDSAFNVPGFEGVGLLAGLLGAGVLVRRRL